MAQKTAEKWKLKKWFEVYSPKVFGETSIGELPADEDDKAVGRIMQVNLSWITHRPEHSFLSVGLRVMDAKNGAAHTELEYMEQMFSYTHSLVKRHSSVVYTVDRLADREKRPLVMKLVVIASGKIATPKKSDIRRKLGEFCRNYASARSRDEIVKGILDNTFHSEALNAIRNITRISKLDVKKLEF